MLYEIERFDKALDMLDRAAELDPRDPTPFFLKAIIFRDLNRPGEAIRTLNHAVKLNDNRAVYRSRYLLDRDLAVKNHHTTTQQVARLARDAGVGQLHLFHLSDRYDRAGWLSQLAEARAIFPASGFPEAWGLPGGSARKLDSR